MFQTLATPFPTQSLRFSADCPPIATSHSNRRPISLRCRASTANEFPGCLKSSRRPTSLYEVLKVKRNASPAEIKRAYRRLAKVFHPDTADSPEYDGRRFMEIHDAYETLSDGESRALYDLSIGFAERIMVASSAGSATPFGCYAGASSSSSSRVGVRPGSYSTRRWETDQCW